MTEHRESPKKKSLLSHPLTNVIVGFLLTGVVGTALTQYFFDRRQDEQLLAQRAQARQDALDIAIQLTVESQIRIERLAEALLADEPRDEIDRLENEQEDAAVQWHREVPRLLLLAKDLLADHEYEEFRKNVEKRLKDEKLDPLRRCLKDALVHAGDVDRVRQIMEDCRFDEGLEAMAVCTEALLSGLHEMTAADGGLRNNDIDETRRMDIAAHVKDACARGQSQRQSP